MLEERDTSVALFAGTRLEAHSGAASAATQETAASHPSNWNETSDSKTSVKDPSTAVETTVNGASTP